MRNVPKENSAPLPASRSPRPRCATPYRSERALTLLEVSIAAFVMAFGIATAIIAIQTGFKTVDVARGTTLASQILQSEIERMRMMSWSNVTALVSEDPEAVDLTSMYNAASGVASRFAVTRLVQLETGARSSDVALITLAVTWTTHDGRSHTRRFESKYIKNGLYDYYYTLARP